MPSLTKIQTGFIEPQGALELNPGTASAPGLFFTGDTSTGMFSPSTGVLGFSTGSTQNALTILANGNVGIGTTNPTAKLDVNGTLNVTDTITSPRFTSTQATGTAPFTVSSTTVVTNLNADLLDGQQGSYYQPASTALTTSTTFGGDVSGTYNAIVVANDSHTHDGRYYTETESDARYLGISAKAADSNLLDGIDSGSFLRSDANDTFTGVLDSSGNASGYRFDGRSFSWNSSMQTPTTHVPHVMQDTWSGWDPVMGIKTQNGFWQFGAYTSDTLHLGYMAGAFGSHSTNGFDNSLAISPSALSFNGNTIWHAGNDGSGSGLDADTLDGIQATGFLQNYYETAINSPDATSGTWTTATSSSWGDPKFNNVYDQNRYTDGSAYVQYNIPSGYKSCWISQLQWSSGGYADCYGVQSDGGLVFLRRINTRQTVENTNEGNPDQHDGSTITHVGSGLDHFTAIRIQNRVGRIHLTGIAWTKNDNAGYEGTGMVHPAQISHQGDGSGLDADTLDGINSGSFLRSDASDTASGAITLSVDTTDALNFSANSTNDARGISFNARTALSADYNDGWLRINNLSEFSNGIYTPGNFRADGIIRVDSTRGITNVTGQYGTIQTNGSGVSNWEGYSIDGRSVFMHDGGNVTGIYNDVDNEWMFYGVRNSYTRMYHNGSSKVQTTSSGVTVTGNVNSTSDIKLKKNIKTIDNALDKVLNLRGVYFDWKEEKMGTNRNIGFIAQEVEGILPEVVTEMEREIKNGDGLDAEIVGTETIKNVSYGNITAVLIESIKEQQKQIEELRSEIQSLKNK